MITVRSSWISGLMVIILDYNYDHLGYHGYKGIVVIMILNKIRDEQNYASSIMAIVIVIMITSVVKIIHYDLNPHNHRDFKTRCSLKAEQDSLT